MNEDDNELYQELTRLNNLKFEEALSELKHDSIIIKKQFLNLKIKHYNDCDNVHNFVLQLFDFIPFIVLFKNEIEVNYKLKEIGIKNEVLLWMIDLKDIEAEIRRLNQINGLTILPFDFLFAVRSHLDLKFKVGLIDFLGLSEDYNNSISNTLFVDTNNRIRRRNYEGKLERKASKSIFEQQMNKQLDKDGEIHVKIGNSYEDYQSSLLKNLKGNTSNFLELIFFNLKNRISKRKVFLELFPLLKLILKDVELLSKDEFHNLKDEYYDGNYEKYKISRVKKILLK